MMYKRFICAISKILPLPKDANFTSSDGIKDADMAEASKKIQIVIKRYTKKHNLNTTEVTKLKAIAVKRFDTHRRAWNKIKSR